MTLPLSRLPAEAGGLIGDSAVVVNRLLPTLPMAGDGGTEGFVMVGLPYRRVAGTRRWRVAVGVAEDAGDQRGIAAR
ncbi:hypothetical protein BAU07_25780 [Bordetella flabilis]|uniref:Uncharacterized protein n=1 Tax=Bordetella flabilis TaxID=463014 RepID=A0A193GJ10_9BORD|nr:hypothetical protein BAU07_25780 [Bordetella flabilis]